MPRRQWRGRRGFCFPQTRGGFVESWWFLGRRHLAGCLFLFGVKKEPKNRHRFDAVDAASERRALFGHEKEGIQADSRLPRSNKKGRDQSRLSPIIPQHPQKLWKTFQTHRPLFAADQFRKQRCTPSGRHSRPGKKNTPMPFPAQGWFAKSAITARSSRTSRNHRCR